MLKEEVDDARLKFRGFLDEMEPGTYGKLACHPAGEAALPPLVFGQQHRLGGQNRTHLLLKNHFKHPIDEGIPVITRYPDIFFFFLLGFMKVGKKVVDRFEVQISEVSDWLDALPPPPQLLRSLDHVVVVVLGPSKIFNEERHEFFLESLEGGVVLDPGFAK